MINKNSKKYQGVGGGGVGGIILNFCVGDIQLLFYHKMPKIWTYLPPCLHLFNFGSPLSPLNIVNLTSTPTHHHYHYHFHHYLSQKQYFVIL